MHCGKPTFMVAWLLCRPGWGPRGGVGPACNGRATLAPQPRPQPQWPSHHVCGLRIMHGFPTMCLSSPPCLLSMVSGIRHIRHIMQAYQSYQSYQVPGTRRNREKLIILVACMLRGRGVLNIPPLYLSLHHAIAVPHERMCSGDCNSSEPRMLRPR